MEKRNYFYGTLIIGIPLLRVVEMCIYELSEGLSFQIYWLPVVGFSLIVGVLLACSAAWLDKGRKRSLWLMPLLTLVYTNIIGSLNQSQSHTLLRGGVVSLLTSMAIDGALWTLIALIATFVALRVEGTPTSVAKA